MSYFLILSQAQSRDQQFPSAAAPVCWEQGLAVHLIPLLLTGQGESLDLPTLLSSVPQLEIDLRAEKMPCFERVKTDVQLESVRHKGSD